ncbi:hypothetical protein CA833_20925 [Novosphingobium sp. KA1]|nr:hypothetical protein CA833_20925 [Novosphingobium sp. KA1]
MASIVGDPVETGMQNQADSAYPTLAVAEMGWLAIVLVYVSTVASMAMVGVAAALTIDLGAAMHVPRHEVGLALSMFSLPSALGAVFCGGLVDRWGARRIMIGSAVLGAIAALVVVLGGGFAMLTLALAVAGIGFTGISVAAPALLVSATTGHRQVRAMSLWSTYAPTGFAVGLLLAAPFAGTGHWQPAFLAYGALMLILALASFRLPAVRTAGAMPWREQLGSFAGVFREAGIVRLACAVSVPSALSYGTSLIAPAYLAEVHGTSLAASATVVAAVKGVAMIVCGLVTGAMLTRRFDRRLLFVMLALLGVAAQFIVFWPGSGFVGATVGLFGWLVAFSGMGAVAMAQLSQVLRDPSQSGAASGLVGQAISVLSFLAPSIYFGMSGWSGFVLLAGLGLLLATLALPVKRRAAIAV